MQVSQELLKAGEGVQGIVSHMALSLSSSLVKAGIGEPVWFQLLAKEVLVPLVMFGAVFRKQQRVVRDTLLFVESCGDRYTCTTHRQGTDIHTTVHIPHSDFCFHCDMYFLSSFCHFMLPL